MTSGIINVYKEAGYTSFDVVARLRGILHTKKIGHTGTLDPDAVGVLPVCIGKATKVCSLLTDTDKEYLCLMRLGIVTDTYDMSGKVLEENEVSCNEKVVIDAIMSFVGEYDQVPPMYSAIKVNGKKLYELAREGKEIERKSRRVNIISINIEEMNLPLVKFRVNCSKGTYIRSLCFDIGKKLGCGACMDSLVRTRVGNFTEEKALKLDEIESLMNNGVVDSCINKIDSVFTQYRKAYINDAAEAVKAAKNGAVLNKSDVLLSDEIGPKDNECFRLYFSDEIFMGIYNYTNNKYKLVKNFFEQ